MKKELEDRLVFLNEKADNAILELKKLQNKITNSTNLNKEEEKKINEEIDILDNVITSAFMEMNKIQTNLHSIKIETIKTLKDLENIVSEEAFFDISGEEPQLIYKFAMQTKSEEDMMELIQYKNPFINRNIAKNNNITLNIMNELLKNHSAYTMNINLAKNINLTEEIKEKLYVISDGQYKESRFREDLDLIFSRTNEQMEDEIEF